MSVGVVVGVGGDAGSGTCALLLYALMSWVVPHTASASAVRPYAGLIAWAVVTSPFL